MSVCYETPKAIGASKAGVESFAQDIAEKIGFSPGDNIEALIERIGGKLVVGSSGHGDVESGSIVAENVKDFTIFVSRHTSLKRDRFTIAHELGHLLLHFGAIRKKNPDAAMRATRNVDPADKSQQRAEWEANWFAAGFLMPNKAFSGVFQKNGVRQAAQEFGVSLSAAETRAKSLGLVDK